MKAVVVGAGVVGRCAALELRRLGADDVTVLERFAPGHTRGSSHGQTRITRSAYTDALWVRLVREAHAVDWARLEADAGESLVTKWPGCFFGPKAGPIADVLAAVRAAGADVVALTSDEARRAFPSFRFDADDVVLDDRTAGVIGAARTMDALARLGAERGVTLRHDVRVREVHAGRVESDAGRIDCDVVVVAAGPFTRGLLPSAPTRPTRQSVAYYDVAGGAALPVWACFDADLFYGIPDVGAGAKVARHVVDGDDDPELERAPDPAELARVDAFVARRFAGRPARVAGEPCFYTMAPGEDFVMDLAAPGVAVAAGLSGHGFKLAPLVGRIVAELAVKGRASSETFEADRARFGLAR